ncbi:ABC transporter ATP-binding protein [Nocardia alni]|uniref:ABC transporter ATP-binding protein n=1 Tax=Nocardia alni TaxID=2815723 RepID=UPI0027E0A3E8|nr:ATP-binding cassette domain-containing protein [Nocardia alni]
MTETDIATAESGEYRRGAEIVLDSITKRYPGQRDPAVEDFSITIPAGEIVVFVGPSGCGKTTTMRMINRLIEPTSGTITIDGRDVTSVNPDRLRRGIGYSIQQAGLFPHLSVARNIATVPGLLGWDRKRISARVDEMLELVGLDPATFRRRYPRQLSGGQQQRVGVARALAADPPVLLMDEPFGAVDPITRGLLQDELLRLQAELHKTIVFVTHDFNEAVKLGDRIAVLGNKSRILQYDTPAAILAEPADDTVAGFVGADAGLKQLTLTRVADVDRGQCPTAVDTDPVEPLRAELAEQEWKWGLILDAQRRPLRWVSADQLAHATSLWEVGQPVTGTVALRSSLQAALETLLADSTANAVVTGRRGEYAGLVTIDTLVAHLAEMRTEHSTTGPDRAEPDNPGSGSTETEHDRGSGDTPSDGADSGNTQPGGTGPDAANSGDAESDTTAPDSGDEAGS